MNNPVWIDDKGKIVEPEYCRDFLSQHPTRCINDRFYTVDGPSPDESKLKRTIYEEISPWLHAKVAQSVEQIIKALKLAAYADPLPLQCDRIHVANGTCFLDGRFTEEKEYCSNRLPVSYRADAPAPEHWLRFLSELLEPEDIPALQEYLGYCLIPSTKGQKMLMLIGKGGEGKSRIGVVMNAIFGLNMNTTSIQKVENNRFARADLEGKLLMATIRSREISACLVLQAQSQLKALYKDSADTIICNCDTSLFLGGKEPTTLKELNQTLGKETIDTFNTGESRGREVSHSLNYQKLGKDLATVDELAVLDGGKCILQLRGVRPFLSDKYDITRHPNYKYLSDADKRNEFDIERFLSRRLKPKPDEVYDTYEIDASVMDTGETAGE